MSKPLQTLLVGAGGYGAVLAEYLLSRDLDCDLELVGVADPYAKSSRLIERLKEETIVYGSMEEFFAGQRADLTIIASPIHLHYKQCQIAFENNSHVLCEKPLVPTLAQLDSLQEKRGDKVLAVGFQWCYSDVMVSLKKRVLAGEFGKPINMKCYVSWPRRWQYFNRGNKWAGKIRTQEGEPVYDSVISNATAHYIQNILFLLGPSMEESAYLQNLQAECYRANHIESFDTIALKGTVGGADVFFCASHATCHPIQPTTEYRFENATIWMNVNSQDFTVYVHHRDGPVENLGHGEGNADKNKLSLVARHIKGEKTHICTAETTRPFTTLIEMLFEKCTFYPFPEEHVHRNEAMQLTYVKNLHIDLWECFCRGVLPTELGFVTLPHDIAEGSCHSVGGTA